MKQQRQRVVVRFWLDLKREDDSERLTFIQQLKGERGFTATLRDGLSLMMAITSLDAERVMDALETIAPWFVAWLEAYIQQRVNTQGGGGEVQKELAFLRGKIEALERSQYIPPTTTKIMQPAEKGPRPLAAPLMPGPVEDDDEDMELSIRKDARTDCTDNFMRSVSGLQQWVDDKAQDRSHDHRL